MRIEPIYEATAFHPRLGDEPVTGRIVLTQFIFRFESEAVMVEIPYNELAFRLDETQEERLLFYHGQHPNWVICLHGVEILRHRVFTGNNHLHRQVNAIFGKKIWKKALTTTLAFFGIALAIGLSASWMLDKIVRFSVNHVSPTFEKNFGDKECKEVKAVVRVSQDPKLIAKLTALMDRLRPGLPDTNMAVEFHIIEMDIPNAGSIPGHVFVTRGLFDLLATPEEMAGVLGHELGHINQKHIFRLIISSQGPGYILKTAFRNSGGTMKTIMESSTFVLGRSFSREYEREADDAGWDYLVAANIDPRGLTDALQKLRDNEYRYGQIAGILSTHPPTDARIERLEAHWRKLKQKSGFIDLTQAAH
jgi:predicted Zn-dependent protease